MRDAILFHRNQVEHSTLFWVVIAAIIGVAPLTIGIAKLRHWI